jgi:hypothetical protein
VVRRARATYRGTGELRVPRTVGYSHAVQGHAGESDNFDTDHVPLRMASLLCSDTLLTTRTGGSVELSGSLLSPQVAENCI